MATLHYESRTLPSDADEVGGDDLYLGTMITGPGALIADGNTDTSAGPGDAGLAPERLIVGTQQYAFVLWNVSTRDGDRFDGFTVDDRTVTITATPSADLIATAWYVAVGGIGDGPSTVVTLGLDRVANRFFRTTPISAVTPGGAWAGGEQRAVATAASAVAIDAKERIEIQRIDKLTLRIDLDAEFESWRMRGVAATGDILTVPQGRGGVAVAVFRQRRRVKQILTIPYWMWQLLHGARDRDVLRHLVRPTSDGPGWDGGLDLDALRPVLERAEPAALRALHHSLGEIGARARDLAALTEDLLQQR